VVAFLATTTCLLCLIAGTCRSLSPWFRSLIQELPSWAAFAACAAVFLGAVLAVSLIANYSASIVLHAIARWQHRRRKAKAD